jgi:hypothetical protein
VCETESIDKNESKLGLSVALSSSSTAFKKDSLGKITGIEFKKTGKH